MRGSLLAKRYFPLFCATAVAIVCAALAGVLSTYFLHAVENIFHHLSAYPRWVLLLAMTCTGVTVGLLWWFVRAKPLGSISEAVGQKLSTFPLARNTLDATLQLTVVGAGASIGREGAPRQLAGVYSFHLSTLLKVQGPDRAVVTASAAGAALAAVYNTPWAGIAYTVCVMMGSCSWFSLAVASVTSWGAVLLSHIFLGNNAFYPLTFSAVRWEVWVWAVVSIPLVAVAGFVFRQIAQHANKKSSTVQGAFLPLTIGAVLALTGLVMLVAPDISGNGVLILQNGFAGNISLLGFLLLILLKPFFTFLTLAAGAKGGALTPALALGGALGGASALATGQTEMLPLFMVVGAGALLAVSENSIAFGLLFALELVHAPLALWGAVGVAAWGSVSLVQLVQRKYKHSDQG